MTLYVANSVFLPQGDLKRWKDRTNIGKNIPIVNVRERISNCILYVSFQSSWSTMTISLPYICLSSCDDNLETASVRPQSQLLFQFEGNFLWQTMKEYFFCNSFLLAFVPRIRLTIVLYQSRDRYGIELVGDGELWIPIVIRIQKERSIVKMKLESVKGGDLFGDWDSNWCEIQHDSFSFLFLKFILILY